MPHIVHDGAAANRWGWPNGYITPVKVAEGTEDMGLDLGIHGETAYLEEGI